MTVQNDTACSGRIMKEDLGIGEEQGKAMRVSFTSYGGDGQIQEPPRPRPRLITPQGEDMTKWAWDATEDPDEEIAEFVPLKTAYEIKHRVHLSLNGIKAFTNHLINYESAANKENLKNAKLWE